MRKLVFIAVATFIGWKYFGPEQTVILGPGIMVADPPRQEKLLNTTQIVLDNYLITLLAGFDIKAKVLSKAGY